MGLRLALGAGRVGIGLLVIIAGARPVLMGIVAGALGALWAADALSVFLYDVHSFDPLSFAGATALLLLVCLIASFLPASRAARVDPLVALRSE